MLIQEHYSKIYYLIYIYIRIDQEFHKCYLNRATCYFMSGNFEEAINDLLKMNDLIESIINRKKMILFMIN
jgi:hypothetical protein